MSWFGSASEWKQGLSSVTLNKVEELESQAEKLRREKLQKQNQLDTLQQALDKQKRKTEDEVKQRQSLEKENEHLGRTCELLQSKMQKGNNDTACDVPGSFNLGTEKILRKRIQDLENEIKSLQNKRQEGHGKVSSDHLQSQSDPFWSHFSNSGNESFLPYKSPCKVMIQKALQTSEENPFKTPSLTPHKKALEISEENPFKTPRKYTSTTSLPSAPSSASKTDHTSQLERSLETALQEIEDLKREKNLSSTANQTVSQDIEICSLKTLLEKTKAEYVSQEQQLHSANDQMSSYKTKAQDFEVKVETLEQRLKALQTELDCQHQNNETAKRHLEDRLKEKESEFNAEASRFQKEIAITELKLRELSTKLQQQESLSLSNQNSLQASLDKVSSQLINFEKEKLLAQNCCSQLETSVNQLQKSDEDAKLMITQLKRDKEMIKAQVDSLKVKLSESESLANRLQSQLANSEQLAMNRQASLEEALTNQKSVVEKEKESHRLTLENAMKDKEKLLMERECRLSELEKELSAIKENIKTAQNERDEAVMKLKQTEEECQQKLAGVNDLEAKFTKLENNLKEKENFVESKEKELREQFEEIKSKLDEEIQTLKTSFEEMKQEKLNLLNLMKCEEEKEQEFGRLQQKAVEMEQQLSLSQKNEEKSRGEKLAVELNMWELEGKIEALTTAESNHQQQKKELMEKIFKLEDALQEQENHLASKESEIVTLSDNLQEASNTIASLVATLEGVKTSLEASDKTVTEKTRKVERMIQEITERDSRIETLSLEKSLLEDSIVKSRNVLKINEEKVGELVRIKEVLARKVETTSAQLRTSHVECQTLKENLDSQKRENEAIINDLQIKLQAVEQENDTLKLLEDRIFELRESKKTLEEAALHREENIRQLKVVVQTLTDRVSERDSTLMKLEEEKNAESQKYKYDMDVLIESNTSMEKALLESADTVMESEKFIKLLQDENESLNHTLSETSDNLSQLTVLNEGLKKDLEKTAADCKNLTTEKKIFVIKLIELGKAYEKVRAGFDDIDLKLSEELIFSEEKAEHYRQGSRLIEEMIVAMKSVEENYSSLSSRVKEMEKEREQLIKLTEEQQVSKENFMKEIEIYKKERFEAEEDLKAKELQFMEMKQVAAEIREEFDAEVVKLNDKLRSLMDEMKFKEERYDRMEEENAHFISVCDELRGKLNHQESVNKNLIQEIESYKEVSNMLRMETSNQEEMMKQNDSLQSQNLELQTTVANLGKKFYELQEKNCELSSAFEKKGRDSSEDSCCHIQDIEKLTEKLNDRELEMVDMGEKMQDQFADLDKLQKENEKLMAKLADVSTKVNDSGHNTSAAESILIESLRDELCQAKLDLQRAREKSDFNVNLAQELDEKVESIRNELNLKITVANNLRKELHEVVVKKDDFEELKRTFDSLEVEHAKLKEELTTTRNQLEDSVPRDKITQKEKELSELTQELICVNGQLEAKNNDLSKENAQLLSLKDMLSNQMEESLRQSAFYERDIQNLQKKLNELHDENAALSNEVRSQKLTLEELESERSSAVDSNKKLLGENAELIHKNEILKEKQKVLEKEVRQCARNSDQESRENDEKMDEVLKARTKEVERLIMRLDTIEKEVGAKDVQMKQVINELQDDFRIRIAEALSMKSIAENENTELQKEILQLKSHINELETINNTKDNNIHEMKLNLDAQNDMNTLSSLQDENEELKLKLDSALKEKDANEKELQHMRMKEGELQSFLSDLKIKMEKVEKENEKSTEMCNELKTKCKELEGSVKATNHLPSTINSLESEVARLRDEMEELKGRNLGLVGEMQSHTIKMKEKEDIVVKQEKDLFNLNMQLEHCMKREEELKIQIETLEDNERKLLLKLEEASEAKSKAHSHVATTEMALQKTEAELSSLKEEKSTVIEENVGLNMLKAELLMKIEKLEVQQIKMKDESKKLKDELENVRTSLAEVHVSVETTRKEKDDLINLVKEKSAKIHELESNIDRMSNTLNELRQTFDIITSEKANLELCINNLREENSSLNVEKETASREQFLTAEKTKSLEQRADERGKAYEELVGKYEDLQNLLKDQEKKRETLRNELKCRDTSLEEAKVRIETLLKELTEVKENIEVEKQNFINKCTELQESNKRVDEAKVNMEMLRAKFSLNQAALHKKDKELAKAQNVIEKLEKNDQKMKSKLKEMHSEAKAKEAKLVEALQEIKDCQEKLNEKSSYLVKLTIKCSEYEKNNENLQKKFNQFQVRNKRLEFEVSKSKGNKRFLPAQTPLASCTKGSQQTADMVDCSQIQGKTLDVNLEASVKKAVTRRAAVMGQTTLKTAETKTKARKRSSRMSHLNVLEAEQKGPTESSASDQGTESFDSHPTRRITRSFYSNSGEKRCLAGSSEEFYPKRIRLGDWEGLPGKVRRGLNDIPAGQQSSGIITRPTTPLKKNVDNALRGPLKLLDTNFERKRNPSLAKETTGFTTKTSPSSSKNQPDLETPSEAFVNAEGDKGNLPYRTSLAHSKGWALRSRNKPRRTDNGKECETQ